MIRSYQNHKPHLPATCYVDLSAQIIGDVVLGERSSVWMNAVLRGDVNSIRLGQCSNVQDCAVLHGQRNLYPVIVGDWVTIGHNATVHGCVPPRTLWAGVPAKMRRDLSDKDRQMILEYAKNYLDYVDFYKNDPLTEL
jgi:carbonic anhydrase/acetyltransferase-like protein (isoleucine patch superfamily)